MSGLREFLDEIFWARAVDKAQTSVGRIMRYYIYWFMLFAIPIGLFLLFGLLFGK